jgi:hypothetical protein
MYSNAASKLSITLLLLAAIGACSGEKSATLSDTLTKKEKRLARQGADSAFAGGVQGDLSQSAASGCDASLWDHVYNPTRLQQLAPCVSVTGTIDESDVDADGDQHFLLKLDPGQDALANKRNQKKKQGDLVLEIVCANPTKMKKAKSACAGYTNPISIPSVGAHVRATGTFVIDSHNGWAEIHPVSKLQGI